MLFFGYSLFYITLATAGFLLGAGFGFFFLCGTTHELLAAAIGGAVLGVLLGMLVIKLERIGVAATGIAGGLVVALYTNGFVMTHVYNQFSNTNQSWMPYAYAGILALIGCILVLKLEKFIIIAATSFGGAYAIGFGVIRLAWGSKHADIGPLYLFSGNGCEGTFCKVALVAVVAVALLGMVVQYKRTSAHEHRFSKKDDVIVLHQNDHTVLLIQGDSTKGGLHL